MGYKPHKGLCLEQIKNSGAGDGSVAKSAFYASSRTYVLIPSPHVTVMAVCCLLQNLGAETGKEISRDPWPHSLITTASFRFGGTLLQVPCTE